MTYDVGGLAEQERDFLGDALIGFLLCLAGIYLTLAWVFESWVRPLVVLAIIPFGFIGTVWGHYQWDLALSIFTVVGLIGMTGIIINNAIVLVSTLDSYGVRYATLPAVVTAAGDRLRPIVLTTLTTLLGLAPLLFERSSQALFLKPTVVTLVYGLGLGGVMVLILVPALVMVERDIALALKAWRRGLRARAQAPRAYPGPRARECRGVHLVCGCDGTALHRCGLAWSNRLVPRSQRRLGANGGACKRPGRDPPGKLGTVGGRTRLRCGREFGARQREGLTGEARQPCAAQPGMSTTRL